MATALLNGGRFVAKRIARSVRCRSRRYWRPRVARFAPSRIWRSLCFRWHHTWRPAVRAWRSVPAQCRPALPHGGTWICELVCRSIELLAATAFMGVVTLGLVLYWLYVFTVFFAAAA